MLLGWIVIMHIRRLWTGEISEVVDLWYQVSYDADGFIPSVYWKKNN